MYPHRSRASAPPVWLPRIAAVLMFSTIALCALSCDVYGQTPTTARSYKAGSILIEAPWARATPGGAQVAGGYVKITNTGQQTDRLLGGSFLMATAVEVHEMTMADGVMKMRRLPDGLEIKPGQTVELKPGGYHIMFTGLRAGLKEGQTIKGSLAFEKAGSIEVEYEIAAIAAQSNGKRMH